MRTPSLFVLGLAAALLAPRGAAAQKIMLNPSNQVNNSVCAGGVESTYALMNANNAKAVLDAAGFTVHVDQDFTNAPLNANSWGAAVYLSVHTNAGGGHGPETLRGWHGDSTAFASKVQAAVVRTQLHPYQNRGTKDGACGSGRCYVLNATNMTAALVEVIFHDCCKTSGFAGHPPSEADYLVSAAGQHAAGQGLAEGVCDYFAKSCTGTTPTTGSLKGVVYQNGDLNQHVAPATVKLSTGATTTYTGAAVWSFDVPPGTYSITASATGFKTATKACNPVTAGAIAYCSINLDADTPKTGFLEGAVYQNGVATDRVTPATVTVSSGASTTYADPATMWKFELPPGAYSVTASAAGYTSATRQCPDPVVAGATASCNVEIAKKPVVVPPDASVPLPLDASIQEPPDASLLEPPDADTPALPDDASAAAADPDAAVGGPDAARLPAAPPAAVGAGCGCSSAASGVGLLPLLLLGLRWRRRQG